MGAVELVGEPIIAGVAVGHGWDAGAVVTADIKMCKNDEMELTQPKVVASSAVTRRRYRRHIAKGGSSERDIRDEKSSPFDPRDCQGAGHFPEHGAPVPLLPQGQVLKSPEAMRPKSRGQRASKLDSYTEYIDRRMPEGLENCVVLHRELTGLGYDGGYSILKGYMSPRRQKRQPEATLRFETAPVEQAQVDWGNLSYIGADGKKRRVWVFVMTMGWSRACYVELVRKADTAAFIQCHVNAFEYLGGVPGRCLYDHPKVITLGKDEEKRPIGTSGCWTLPGGWALRLGCASLTEPRPRAG